MQSANFGNYVKWYFPMYHNYSRVIVFKIREYRLKAGLTQAELAKKAHTSKNAIYAYEHGNYCPTLISLCDIAKALNCDITDLFTFYNYDS